MLFCMPKRTVTTIIGAGLDVSTGSLTVGEQEVEARVLHIFDEGERIDVVIEVEAANKLADLLRADGIVTAKVVPIPGTKGVK